MNKTLSIKVISNGCGVLPHTLRIWEKRYKVFSPERTAGGQRLYSEADLAKAKLLVALIEEGHSISNLASRSLEELRSLLTTDNQNVSVAEKRLTATGTKKLLHHLTNFEIDLVVSEMQYLRMSIGAKDFIFKIVLPVMQEVGVMVAKGKYSISQEHIVSTIVRDQLSKINLPNAGQDFARFALATPEGNQHELSILIADIICRANRVSTIYLGAAHPAQCLAEAINALKCKTIVMGVLTSDQWDYEKNIIPYLTSLDNSLKEKVKVILGGGWEVDFPAFKKIEKVVIMESFEEFDEMLRV